MADRERIDAVVAAAPRILMKVKDALSERFDKDLTDVFVRIDSRITPRSIQAAVEDRLAKEGPAEFNIDQARDLFPVDILCVSERDLHTCMILVLRIATAEGALVRRVESVTLRAAKSTAQAKLLGEINTVLAPTECELLDANGPFTSLTLLCWISGEDEFPPVEIRVSNIFDETVAFIDRAMRGRRRSVTPLVNRHLTVLMSLFRSCAEYIETIQDEIGELEANPAAGVEPLLRYDEDLAAFSPPTRALFEWIRVTREANKHQAILDKVKEARSTPAGYELGNPDVDYLLRMEEALSEMKLNRLVESQRLYERLAVDFPGKAMVHFRLTDIYKLCNKYPEALDQVRIAEEALVAPGGASKAEGKFMADYLPMKKSYYLWSEKHYREAYQTLDAAYQRLDATVSADRKQKIFSSVAYYALECARAEKKLDVALLGRYIEKMKKFGMDSIATALPEAVDTYAWICYYADIPDAKRAMSEVLSCIKTGPAPGGSFLVHKGEERAISTFEVNVLYEHVQAIILNLPHSP